MVEDLEPMTTTATRIILLDDHTKNQIAAGEVIERPASVVKELVENAIDAGATQVRVDLEEGGRKLVRVTDNGCGMSREDAILSVQRHATSKIANADDLARIATLGFRGEALPSIASVSFVEIETKSAESGSGTRLRLEAGRVVEVAEVGIPNGTKVEVHNLFYNVPVRMKFMRAPQTELGHCAEMLSRLAVSRPEVAFKLSHGGREVLATTGSGDPLEAIAAVHGQEVANSLIRAEHKSESVRLSAYVSNPSLTRATRALQVFFVNSRCVRAKILIRALDDAYRGVLPTGRWPVAFAFIELPPELVDVNVHPAKAEVKFARDWEIHSAIVKAIQPAITSIAAAPSASSAHPDHPAPAFAQQRGFIQMQDLVARPPIDTAAFREALRARIEASQAPTAVPEQQTESLTQPIPSPARLPPMRAVQVIGQARNLYIIAQNEDGILIIDQHAAHERVLYEKLMGEAETGATEVQRLVIPFTLSLGHREAAIAAHKLDDLRAIGFDLEPFGPGSFVVRAVPARIANKNYHEILRDAIDEMAEMSVARRLVVPHEQLLVTMACKMAIKSGDPLSREEQVALVRELLETNSPLTCPHGRPVITTLGYGDLDKRFGR